MSSTLSFRDILYGRIELPMFVEPFLSIPEFVRLRGVGLSNVDSVEFKDFNGPSRWEHGVAVAWLALSCAERIGLPLRETVQLALSGLLHDIATPPFAHTAEYVLSGFDHEVETRNVLAERRSPDAWPNTPVFQSELPQFRRACASVSRQLGVEIDPDEVANMVVGEGDLGFLISGTLDLDNADNVTRACMYLGWEVDRNLPSRLAHWLAEQRRVPVEVESIRNDDVQKWVGYRRQLYDAFFESSDSEQGREAFLQHLMRRALGSGLSRRSVIWNTEDQLLADMARVEEDERRVNPAHSNLGALVRRYRLLETPVRLLDLAIEDPDVFRTLYSPQAAAWVEHHLSSDELELMIRFVAKRRTVHSESLLDSPEGSLLVFKLGNVWHYDQLPGWLRDLVPPRARGKVLQRAISRVLSGQVERWAIDRPWLSHHVERAASAREVLDSIEDWSFRLSRNDNFHVYPGTFVHAIPASLITALQLRGELVLDPFGGTGQTAIEAVKLGGHTITSDASTIATMVARARLTYLSGEQRRRLRCLSVEDLCGVPAAAVPTFPNRDRWHHSKTLEELCQILGYIGKVDCADLRGFLKATFSSILPSMTARRGLQHGFFADNTPLKGGVSSPPYIPAFEEYISKVNRNIDLLEKLYAFFERNDRDPESELGRASVFQLDARLASPADYGVSPHSVAAIVTSPPYVGMADYVLGNRLSYYWLAPSQLDSDFVNEVGARRRRFSSIRLLDDYLRDIEAFAESALRLLRPGGFLATVVGSPQARSYAKRDISRAVEDRFFAAGFTLLWEKDRAISWHRNHGYQRLSVERVSVYVAPE